MAVLKYKNPNYVVGGAEKKYLPLSNVIAGNSEVYIGETEPTNREVIWINPNTDEMKYWNGLEWATVSGKAEETLIISLASNQTNPDSNLNGVIVNVRYLDVDHKQAWIGEALSFNIPDGTEYTIEYSDITDEDGNKIYATPAMETYTAVGNETRTLSRYYNQTRITITRSSNLGSSDTLGSSTASISCSSWSNPKEIAFSDLQPEITIGVLTGDTISIVFSDITNHSTPTISSFIAEGTSMSKSAVYTGCMLTIQRTNNQEVTMSTDTSATVTYSSYSQTVNFTSSENSITIIIPYDISYTIAFNGDITNYRTPANITGTSSSTAITEVGSYDSEKLTVNVSGLTSGFTITVNGQSQTATSGTYYIAYDTAYTISASSVKGYNKEISESSIAAGQQIRTVTVIYAKIPNGIYICDNTGALTAVGSWNTANNSSAIGVAVVSDNCNFVIEKTVSYSHKAWGGYGTTISGITTTTDTATAKTDYAGETNTTKIISQLGSGNAPAADYCKSSSCTVNGTTLYGYVGSGGEWQTAYNNKSAIDSALSTIGGTAMDTSDYHWTSTQYSSSRAWILHWDYGYVYDTSKDSGYYVRAFYPLP